MESSGPFSTHNSTLGHQVGASAKAGKVGKDNVAINCFFLDAEHNSTYDPFYLVLPKDEFNEPLGWLRDQVKTSLLAEHAFHADLPAIQFYTPMTRVTCEEVFEVAWLSSIEDIKKAAKRHSKCARISLEDFDADSIHFLVTAQAEPTTEDFSRLKTVKNSIEVRQATEPVAAEDDIDINCFFFSEHNSQHLTFPLTIARNKFTKPLQSLLGDVVTKLVDSHEFSARKATIRFYTLKTPFKAEAVDEEWFQSIEDIEAVAKSRQAATRIKTILGAVEDFDEEALHLLITAEKDTF
ncbi:hypothetical protein EUX98_g8137 [Antrodiella citrinella]|uniref:Uncharacterized protein n=1 Tax=Antrodiella citrinella TaxID=2447956 RepID=A0A4S4MC37_9APHY|nr:hypothetical protein EUX98_g8137 [Antrodiella citrinella]